MRFSERSIFGKKSPPAWHNAFMVMVPKITSHAKRAFRYLRVNACAKWVREIACRALASFARRVELNRVELGDSSALARFGVAQSKNGREIDGRLSVHDVSSPCRHAEKVITLDRPDRSAKPDEAGLEVLREARHAGPTGDGGKRARDRRQRGGLMTANLLTKDALRSSPGGAFAYVSPSRLNCWIKCPRAFSYRYLEGIQTPPTPGLFLGTAVHWALEVVYRQRQLGIALEAGDVAQRLKGSWGSLIEDQGMEFHSAAEEQALQRQAVDLVAAYLTHIPSDEPKPLAVETVLESPLVDPDTGEDLGIPLVGIVDLVLDGSDGPLIADFKTSARSSEPLEIFHEIQLSSYAYLFRQVEQQREAGLEIRSLIKTKQVKIEFHRYAARTDAHFQRLFAVIHDYLDALDAGRFNYRPGLGCSMCDFREPCARWNG